MPYAIKKRGEKWHVINTETDEDKGESDSEEMAKKHMAALYAHEKKDGEPCPDCGRPDCPKKDSGGCGEKRMDIAAREGVNPERGEHEYGDVQFADPKNKKYPIDTEEHIRAAWNYIHKAKNAGEYSAEDVATMKGRIAAAWKKVIGGGGPPAARKDGLSTVRRYDVLERLDGATLMPNGWLKADALIARTGIQLYRRADGSVQREFRPPEEVFDSASLASFKMVPVTDEHPSGLLDAKNARTYQRGHLGEAITKDGNKVRATLLITDGELVKKVLAGKTQLSAGYVCDLEDTPGEWMGERYDCIQRAPRGNHVAIVDRARGGAELCLKLDSEAAESIRADRPAHAGSGDDHEHREERQMAEKIKIDGIEGEVANDVFAQHVSRAFDVREAKIDALEKAVKAARADADKATADTKAESEQLRARATVAESKLAEAEKARKDAADALPALVNARVALIEQARGVLGEDARFDNLNERKIKEAVILKLHPDIKLDGEADSFVEGVFKTAMLAVAKQDSKTKLGKARGAAGKPEDREKPEEHLDASEVREKAKKASEEAWKTPSVGMKAQ